MKILDGKFNNYKNPRERAKAMLQSRHGPSDVEKRRAERSKSIREGSGLVVKGPAGGYSTALVNHNQTPSPLFMKQGTVAKLHKMNST
jgi:hypothetical protein